MNEELTIELIEENIEIEAIEEDIEIELKSNETIQTTNDYEKLRNKPKIEGIELLGDKSLEDLGATFLTNCELEELLK